VREVKLYAAADAAAEPLDQPIETVRFGDPEEQIDRKLRDLLIREMVGNQAAGAVKDVRGEELIPDGKFFTVEDVDAVLAHDVREIRIRHNNIRGIEVDDITDEKSIIEPLRDRIVGRVAAADIFDPDTGELIVGLNQEITEEIADHIVRVRNRKSPDDPDRLKVKIRSVLTCRTQYGVCIKCYGRNLATGDMVDVGEAVGIIAAQSIGEPGTQLTMRTFHTGGVAGEDITQGLPRVEELFEARKPKRPAVLAEVEGEVEIREAKGIKKIVIKPQNGEERIYQVPHHNVRIMVNDGDKVKVGDRLTEGAVNPHDILRVQGLSETQRYLVYEVQKVYKSQGVEINDKHIEVMIRQMLHKVKVEEPGDTELLPGEYIDVHTFERENAEAIEAGGEPAVARPILLGITKASLATDSFLSAASFQETTRVLTEAAIKGKVDPLLGLKENVIIGKLVPAGTGMSRYRNIRVRKLDEPQDIEGAGG